MDQYIGKMLDNRYEILERIGTGGMAVVYKAKCHRLNRLVAIKILKSDLAQDEDFRRRFNAESQAVAQLSHPNIVSVYDVSRGGDIEYIVMELIDGITLKQYMEKRGQLNWRESLHFITQIMRGLSHAHSRGIVHRDIKPQNVMVLRDGSVKVADFGIACLENAAQTLTQEALGSVHYISPEQARGDRIDARSDIYSAGVVLYEMLTGRLPFEGDSAVSVAIQHLSSIPLAPREINPEIPEQLELICMKAMAPDLENRYASADAMIADLEAFRKNPGVNLDFELEDLRPNETDEPTQMLRTAGVSGRSLSSGGQSHRSQRDVAQRRQREYDDDYYYDDPSARRGGRRQTALVVAAVALALVVIFFLFRFIFTSFLTPENTEHVVPSLVGMTVEEAEEEQSLVDGIFEIGEVESEFSSEYEEGEIIRQNPKADDTKKGELPIAIDVWVSAGEDSGKMIDVTNKTVSEATVALRSLIEQYNLTIDASEEYQEYSEEVTENYIIRTEPANGDDLHEGDTIKLYVSKGPQPVTLISFRGSTLEMATNLLEQMGLSVGNTSEEPSDEFPKGTIISQTPEEGSSVKPGSKVDFVISSGSGTGGQLDEYALIIPLPTDRDQAAVQVIQDGVEVYYDAEVDCRDGNLVVHLQGTGTAQVETYIDGELCAVASGEIPFGNV